MRSERLVGYLSLQGPERHNANQELLFQKSDRDQNELALFGKEQQLSTGSEMSMAKR